MILFLPLDWYQHLLFFLYPQGSLLRNPSSGQCLELRVNEVRMDKCDQANVYQRWEFSWPAPPPSLTCHHHCHSEHPGVKNSTFSMYDTSCCRAWASPQWELWRWTRMEGQCSVNHPGVTFDFKCIYSGANAGKTIGKGVPWYWLTKTFHPECGT